MVKFLHCLVEREENVKVDIFSAYIALLRNTRPAALASTLIDPSLPEPPLPEDSPLALLQEQVSCFILADTNLIL